MEYEHDNLQPTFQELMDNTLIPAEVMNRNFDQPAETALTIKDLQDVISALSGSMESKSEMNSSLAEENTVDDTKTDDVVISQPNKTDTSDNNSAVTTDEKTAQGDIIVNYLTPKGDPEETKTDTVNNIDTNKPINFKQNYKRILQLTDKMEATFKFGSLNYQMENDEIQLLNKIKRNMSLFKNYNEFISFLYFFILKQSYNIGEELYLLFNLILYLPHPLRYLYLIEYAPFGRTNGYGYYIHEFGKALDEYSKRRRYLCDQDTYKAQNAVTETEAVLSSQSCKRLIKDDIIYMVNQLKSEMDVFTDYLSFVEFLYEENKICRLEPAGYLILNIIYILPNPAKYLYLLKFDIREDFLIKIMNDIKTKINRF